MVTCLICGKTFSAVASKCQCNIRDLQRWLSRRSIFGKGNGHTQEVRIPQKCPLVARNVDISSKIMYSMTHGKWIGFECGGAERIEGHGAFAATACGIGQASA